MNRVLTGMSGKTLSSSPPPSPSSSVTTNVPAAPRCSTTQTMPTTNQLNGGASLNIPPPAWPNSQMTNIQQQNNQPQLSHKEWRQKNEGYPVVAEFMNLTDDFLLFRRFGSLNTRALLFQQWQIEEKERELHAMDVKTKNSQVLGTRNDSFKCDRNSKREFLMKEIVELLDKYNQYLTNYSSIRERASAPDYQVNKLMRWHNNHYGATHHEDDGSYSELNYLQQRRDVIPLIPKLRTPLRYAFENLKFLRRLPCFQASLRNARSIDDNTFNISERGFEWFVSGFIVVSGLALLFGPMWWLNFVDTDVYRLGIITAFVSVFCILLTLSTVSRPFEVLGGTAAYAAVLMVFLQIQHTTPSHGAG